MTVIDRLNEATRLIDQSLEDLDDDAVDARLSLMESMEHIDEAIAHIKRLCDA